MALVTVMSVGMLMAVYLSHSSAVTRRQAHSIELKQSFYLAEAGLAESIAGLAIGKTGKVGSEASPAVFGQGLFWVEATDLAGSLVQLDCTAMVGQTRAQLSVVAERGEVNVAALGIFGGDGVSVQPGSVIDAFDSEVAAYSSKTADGLARIGSNGPITLRGATGAQTKVAADVLAGPDDTVTIDGNVLVLGETASALTVTELPAVTMPAIALGTGIVHAGATPLVIPEGSTGLEALRVTSNAEVVIQGPASVSVGELVVESGGSLEVDASAGPVDLYVSSKLDFQAGSTLVTGAQDTTAVSIQVAGELATPVKLAATSAFHGVIYVPQSDVEVANGFDVYGALVAKTVTFTGAANLHFDARLQRAAAEGSLPSLLSWRIVELSTDGDVFTDGDDPFTILGVSRAALSSPAAAHEDQNLSISYLDGGSVLHTYDGLESGFDWSSVSVPLDVSRDGKAVAGRGAAAPPDPGVAMQQAIEDLIASAASSAQMKTGLLAASPLPELTLVELIDRPNLLSSADLRAVLEATPALDDAVLLAAIADDTLSSADMTSLLNKNAPISSAVRSAATSRSSILMNALDLLSILALPLK